MGERLIFKKCPMCTFEWETRDQFLDDSSLELNGYQVDFEQLDLSLYLFTHHKKNCFSTMAVRANEFSDLYTGEKYTERKTGSEVCPGYCLDKEQLARCDAFCDASFNREVMQIIKSRQGK